MNSRLRRRVACAVSVLAGLIVVSGLAAHELFLKLESYFLPANRPVRAFLLNGTFTKSEGVVARDRVADLSLVSPAGRSTLDSTALSARNDTTFLALRTGAEGTYVVGLSVKPREIALTGEQFTGYLKEEGIEDMLAERAKAGSAGEPAKERYAKHVKAVIQVGSAHTPQFETVLGYTAELVPLDNPYTLKPGSRLRLRALVDGVPVPGLMVLAGGSTPRGTNIAQSRTRTDAQGLVTIELKSAGRWYAKFISMRHSVQPGLTHESQWATLTFEIR